MCLSGGFPSHSRYFSFSMMNDLPKITRKQHAFVLHFATNGENASKAYRDAYECKIMSNEAINVEASRLLKNTKVALWIEYYRQNTQQVVEEEFKYTQIEHFKKLNELQKIALECSDKQGNPNINAAIKVEELKGKMGGCYEKQPQAPSMCGFIIGDED